MAQGSIEANVEPVGAPVQPPTAPVQPATAPMQPVGSPFDAASSTIELRTTDESGFHDITDSVQQFVMNSGIQTGVLVAQSLHTTAGLLLNECETGFKADLATVADRLVPSAVRNDVTYVHDDFTVRWENICPEDFEAPNGHSHIQHAIIGSPSVTLIVQDRMLTLGRWQRLFLLEFDRPRDRRVALTTFGVKAPVNGAVAVA